MEIMSAVTGNNGQIDLLQAIKRMDKLNSDIESITDWLADVQSNSKPVIGRSWVKVSRAVQEVVYDLAEERDGLEEKINIAVQGIQIEID